MKDQNAQNANLKKMDEKNAPSAATAVKRDRRPRGPGRETWETAKGFKAKGNRGKGTTKGEKDV